MTGFGRANGTHDQTEWTWELRAVNGKGLDVRLRLPSGFDRLEARAKKVFADALSRGNIQATLSISRERGGVVPAIDEEVLQDYMAALAIVEKNSNIAQSSGAEMLALKGVMQFSEPELDADAAMAIDHSLIQGLVAAVTSLNEHRQKEGEELADILLGQIAQVEQMVDAAEADPSRSTEAIAANLQQQLARLGALNLDQERLYQEVALLATKSDIREELDRLKAHVISARKLVETGSPVGRKLEFLSQELNRETNTLCSKSSSVQLTEIGLQLKVVVDQFREQILNVE